MPAFQPAARTVRKSPEEMHAAKQSKLAEENREIENRAATTIQSYYRAFIVRRSLKMLNDKAIVIQKVYCARLAK